MDPGIVGLILLVAVAIAASLFLHFRDRSLLRASFISSIIATGVLQIADVIYRGYPDRYLPIAFVVGLAVAFVISTCIGLLIRKFRQRTTESWARNSDS
jgi:hypothetical protein